MESCKQVSKVLTLIYGLLMCDLTTSQVPRSCEESLIFGNNYTGLHTLQSLDGASYSAFCQFDAATRTGLTFISRYAVESHKLDIDLMFTARDHAVVRFLNNDGSQSEALVKQLPQYSDIPLGIEHNTAINYNIPKYIVNFGSQYLLLGFLNRTQARRKGMQQGWISNDVEITYNNCDANPNNNMVFYPDVNVGSTPSYYNYQIVNDYLNSTIATKQENYLEPVAEFSYTGEMHFGGCGALSCSRYWDVKGWALGIPFRSMPCSTDSLGSLSATQTWQSSYYPGDIISYCCDNNYTNRITTELKCGLEGQWIDARSTYLQSSPTISQDAYIRIADPSSWQCTWTISDVIPHVTRFQCAMLCTEQPQCMMFAIDGTTCILTNGIMGSSEEFVKYTHWYIKR